MLVKEERGRGRDKQKGEGVGEGEVRRRERDRQTETERKRKKKKRDRESATCTSSKSACAKCISRLVLSRPPVALSYMMEASSAHRTLSAPSYNVQYTYYTRMYMVVNCT